MRSKVRGWRRLVTEGTGDLSGLRSSHYNLGVALCGSGKIQDGLKSMEHAVQFMPTHAAAHAALGQIYRHLGNPAQSLVHYRRAAALGADDSVVITAVAELEALMASR